MALGDPLAREDRRLARRLRAQRAEARARERAEHGRAGLARERGLDLELAGARGIELRDGMVLGAEALRGARERLAEQRVIACGRTSSAG